MSQDALLREFLNELKVSGGVRAQTSGSTGKPKNIFLPETQLSRSALRTNAFFGITPGSRLHCAVSFKYIGGKMMIMRCVKAGCSLTYSNPSLIPESPCGQVCAFGKLPVPSAVSLMSVVGAQMDYILSNPTHFAAVERFLIGGSAIDDRMWTRIATSGLECWESYGMTETASHIALRRIENAPDANGMEESRRTRFFPLPGISLATNRDGCLIIKDEEIEVETNDIATLFPDGSFEIRGRKDDVIITGGIKVFPQDIENLISPRLKAYFKDFYITSVPDEKWTSKIVLAIVAADCSAIKKAEECLAAIPHDILPVRLRPKEIILIDQLPLTSSGKLKRILP